MVNGKPTRATPSRRRGARAKARGGRTPKKRARVSTGSFEKFGYSKRLLRRQLQALFGQEWHECSKEDKCSRITQAWSTIQNNGTPADMGTRTVYLAPSSNAVVRPKTVQPVRTVMASPAKGFTYPPTWKPQQDNFSMVVTDPSSKLHKHVTGLFFHEPSMREQYDVVSVARIQNKYLYTTHNAWKTAQARLLSSDVTVRALWHGTTRTSPLSIVGGADGLDPAFSSVGFYGRGVYFATNPAYSDESYAHVTTLDDGRTVRQLLLCYVVVGKSLDYGTTKNYRLLKAPNGHQSVKGGPHKHSEHCKHSTDMYVVYVPAQVYPAAILTYVAK